MALVDNKNLCVVIAFYEALQVHNGGRILDLLASEDLEWWFHGPPHEQHLINLLSGMPQSSNNLEEFVFVPMFIQNIGNIVFVEGEGKKRTNHENKYWVHVWTIKEGKIVQLREYFNTSLIVLNQSPNLSSCNTLWQSQLGQANRKSMPSMILAI